MPTSATRSSRSVSAVLIQPGDRPLAGFWLVGIVAATIVVVMLVLKRISIIPIEADPLRQVLLTVGFAFLFQQAALDIWTGNNFDINPPDGADRRAS